MNTQDYNLFYLFNNDNNINTELVKFDTYFNLSIEEFNYNSDKKYLLSQFDYCDTYFIFNYLKCILFKEFEEEEDLFFNEYSSLDKHNKRKREDSKDRESKRIKQEEQEEQEEQSLVDTQPVEERVDKFITPKTVVKIEVNEFLIETSFEDFKNNFKNIKFSKNIIEQIDNKLQFLKEKEHYFDLDLLDTIKNILQKKSYTQKILKFKTGGENDFFSLNKIKLKCSNILQFFFVCDIIHDIHSIRDTSTSENSSDTQKYKDYDCIELLDIEPDNIILNEDDGLNDFFKNKYRLSQIEKDEKKKNYI